MECIDPEQQKGPFHEWVANPSVRSYIKRQLVKFFTHFRENEQPIYFQRLKRMCHNNEHSLLVEWAHLKQANPKLAEWLAMHPLEVLPEYHAVVYALAVKTCPSYKDIVH
jgi:DNA replicative helicase MCM subunit Mcm2 (Cdc46/Mcm family)